MYSNIIRLVKTSSGNYEVRTVWKDHLFGEFLIGDDGYYAFWFPIGYKPTGCFDAGYLRALADALDDLNKEWHEMLLAHDLAQPS